MAMNYHNKNNNKTNNLYNKLNKNYQINKQ